MTQLEDVANELLAIVDDNDVEIGAERRCVIHEKKLLHRASHIIVFDKNGKVFVQKRSATKDTFPLYWECVGGHVGPGETYEAAAIREVMEELGVPVGRLERLAKTGAGEITGYEFIEIFKAVVEEEPEPLESEVIALERMTFPELMARIESGERQFSPSFINSLNIVKHLLPR